MEASSLVRSGSCHVRLSPRFGRLAASGRRSSVQVALRRLRSDPDLIVSGPASAPCSLKRQSFSIQSVVTEEEKEEEIEEEEDFFDGGIGKGGKLAGGGNGGSRRGDQNQNENYKRIHYRYKEMLRSDPTNPLLLRNYGKFLHEEENDVKGAEEMYGRALLECPDDGEVLMLYGRLVWEKRREKDRAEIYMDRALEASPNDSEVLRGRALFLWETGEEDEEEENNTDNGVSKLTSQPLISAF